jgi:hypothetical protein
MPNNVDQQFESDSKKIEVMLWGRDWIRENYSLESLLATIKLDKSRSSEKEI